MLRRLLPGGLRAQLAIVIAAVMALSVGASFLAVYSVTGSRLRSQIDAQLRTQVSEWQQFTARADLSTPAALERAATQFIAAQRYHAESLLIVVQAAGGRTVSNNPELLAREEARGRSAPESIGLLDSPSGLSSASVAEAGGMRVLATPILSGGRTSEPCAWPTRSRRCSRRSRVCGAHSLPSARSRSWWRLLRAAGSRA